MSAPAVIEFFVHGCPKGQPRARSFVLRGRGGKPILDKTGQPIVRSYDPATAEAWKNQIAIAAKPHIPFIPLSGPIQIDVDFIFPRPKAHYRTGRRSAELRSDAPEWHCSVSDRDNLDKAVLDVLQTVGLFENDSQVCLGTISKTYGDRPGARIRIEQLSHLPPKSPYRVPDPYVFPAGGLPINDPLRKEVPNA